jgi:hypothetical protein
MASELPPNRFVWLLAAILVLLVSYPYFMETPLGRFFGGLTAILVLMTGVYAMRGRRITLIASIVLAGLALSANLISAISGIRGSAWTEAAFSLFYAYTTVVMFVEVLRMTRFTRDSMFGIISVYLLIGLTFGSLYDLIETLNPGSFSIHVEMAGGGHVGFRQLLYYSFMNLTTIGFGDITPVTTQAQSLAILEGVTGVLYVAVLIARIVNAYDVRK